MPTVLSDVMQNGRKGREGGKKISKEEKGQKVFPTSLSFPFWMTS